MNKPIGIAFAAISLMTLPVKVFAYDFHYSPTEVEIYNTDFNTDTGWSLQGTTVESGRIRATSEWGKASYQLANPIALEQGDFFIYWAAIFPEKAKTELDKFYVEMVYGNNLPVCWKGGDTSQQIPKPEGECPGDYPNEVDEDAVVKMSLRPGSYDTLYQDTAFGPTEETNPIGVALNTSFEKIGIEQKYRLQFSKYSSEKVSVIPSFFNEIEGRWQAMEVKEDLSDTAKNLLAKEVVDELPLLIDYTSELAIWEAFGVQFRQAPGSTQSGRHSAITAMALTQVRQQQAQVPEPSTLALIGAGFLSLSLARQKR